MTKATNTIRKDHNTSDQIVVKLTNLINGNDKTAVLPDNHRTVVATLDFFAQTERVPMNKIDIQVSPLVAKAAVVPPVELAMAA